MIRLHRQIRKRSSVLFPSIFLSLACGGYAQACQVSSQQPNFLLGASYESRSVYDYNDTGLISNVPLTVTNCSKTEGKFLMVNLGFDHTEYSSEMVAIRTSDQLKDTGCTLSHSPFKDEQPFAEKQAAETRRFKFMQECTQVRVRDEGHGMLVYPDKQPACSVVREDSATAVFTGPFCFFQIFADSGFKIEPLLRKECSDREYIKSHGIDPQDVPATLAITEAGDASGMSEDLNPLDWHSVRFSLDAGKELMPIASDDGYGGPRWPAHWAADVHFGPIRFSKQGDHADEVNVSFLVDHRCPETCVDGVCSSSCNYLLPLGAEMTLSKIDAKGKKEVLDSWYQGGVAPAQWQGIVKAFPESVEAFHLREGETYQLDARFSDPQSDYLLFKNHFRQFLIDLSTIGGKMPGKDPLPSIPALRPTKDLPAVPDAPILAGPWNGTEFDDLKNALQTLRRYLGFSLWPPAYTQVCDSGNGAACASVGRANSLFTLSARFQLKASQGQFYALSPVQVERQSLIHKAYRETWESLPEYSCPRRRF